LGVFLALLLEDELALLVVVLVLTPTPVLTTLLSLLAFGTWRHGGYDVERLAPRCATARVLLRQCGGVLNSVIAL
jgi:hypothetical protein